MAAGREEVLRVIHHITGSQLLSSLRKERKVHSTSFPFRRPEHLDAGKSRLPEKRVRGRRLFLDGELILYSYTYRAGTKSDIHFIIW